jgi:hypothetical protein
MAEDAPVQQEHEIDAGHLTARHIGNRIYIKRTDRGEVLAGRLASVEHRLSPSQPEQQVNIATDVTVLWQPDVFFRITLHPGEPVILIPTGG